MEGKVYHLKAWRDIKRKRTQTDSSQSPLVLLYRRAVQAAIKNNMEMLEARTLTPELHAAVQGSIQTWADSLLTLEEIARRMAKKASL
jgi:hypothetical protein